MGLEEDHFIQEALQENCGKFRYEEVRNFLKRHGGILKYRDEGNKLVITIMNADPTRAMPIIVKIEKPHSGPKTVPSRYVQALINALVRGGLIGE